MKKILVVEDDINIHNIIEELLKRKNYEVFNAYSGTEALMLLEKVKVDLIILDLMLPGIKGEDILKEVTNTKIIVLSAKNGPSDKVKCLMDGANDYITKPFNSDEFLARVEVQLRDKIISDDNLKYKDLELLNDNHTLLVKNNKVNLTKTEYAILKQLLLNSDRVIAKNKLLDLISNDTFDGDENSLKVHISNIRRKIKMYSNDNYIESVWGIGFKMIS